MSSFSSRRAFLKNSLQGSLVISATSALPGLLTSCGGSKPAVTSKLPPTTAEQTPLPYGYDALEPVIDAKTMEIHYTKHAAAYAKNYRDAVAEELKGQAAEPENVLAKVTAYSAKIRNNGGGHYNHELFWKCMQPAAEQQPSEKLMSALQAGFGSLDGFKSKFIEAAMARFGSGWAWLYLDAGEKLQIGSTPNQDNPLMDASTIKGVPLLGLDVWEHAYYLKYQNRRAEYIDNWFRLVNWTYVEKRFDSA